LNDIFKALADPTRRKILKMLRERDLTAGEISDAFNISKPSISHHLNLLKQANLVMGDKQGQNVLYSLNTTVFQDIVQFFYELQERGKENETK